MEEKQLDIIAIFDIMSRGIQRLLKQKSDLKIMRQMQMKTKKMTRKIKQKERKTQERRRVRQGYS